MMICYSLITNALLCHLKEESSRLSMLKKLLKGQGKYNEADLEALLYLG
jgi:hypothetical protein